MRLLNKRFKFKNKKKNEPFSLFGKALDIPVGVTGLKVEIFGNKRAVIDGCKGVVEYYDSIIRLNVGNGTVNFLGHNLHILTFELGVVELTGIIENIEYGI